MTNPSFSDLLSVIERHARYDYLTPIDGLKVGRTDLPSEVGHSIYQPSFGLVARGVKELMVGETAFRYAAGEVPALRGRRSGHVAGHRGAPFRALPRDPPRDRSCSRRRSPPRAVGRPAKGRRPLDRRQVYARSRSLRPIDPTGLLAGAAARHPGHGAVDPARDRLEAAAYGHGPLLSQLAFANGHATRIGRTTAWIRENYAEALSIPELAAMANMSVPELPSALQGSDVHVACPVPEACPPAGGTSRAFWIQHHLGCRL